MIDYQWPSPEVDKIISFPKSDPSANRGLKNKIESFFAEKFGYEVILVPSGRAGISLLLSYYKINRSHTVFAPQWTSHCVWDMVTRLANPTIDCDAGSSLIIAVHKWGEIEKLGNKHDAIVIEDSVDSVLENGKTLFPNSGDFEIISLPKTIGSYTGGLIIARDKDKAGELRSQIKEDEALGAHQSKLRAAYYLKQSTGYEFWEDREHNNTSLDYSALMNINSCLGNYALNLESIRRRMELVIKKTQSSGTREQRFPPVWCIEYDGKNLLSPEIMIRNKNYSGYLDKPEYRKVGLIPLHFTASDEFFEMCLNQLCKS